MAVHLPYCLSAGAQFGSLFSATCVSVNTDSLSCSPRVKKCTSDCVACLISVERVAISLLCLDMRLYCTSRPFWLKICFSVARPPIPMRSDTDPFWDHGLGFGPVRRRTHRLDFPWESGTFGFLSGEPSALTASLDSLLSLPQPVPRPCTQPVAISSALGQSSAAGGLQSFKPPGRGKDLSWSSREEQNRRIQALCKWSTLLRLEPRLFSESAVSSLPDRGDQSVLEHLDVVFSKKSANTLLSRAQPLTRFVLWRKKTCPDECLSEQLLWLHCKWLQGRSAASSLDSLVSSFHFVHGTLGLRLPVADLLSARVRGLAHAHLKTKDEVDQAPPLTVAQLRWLEHFANTADDLYERLIACSLCFMVYARARRSDLARATHIDFDLTEGGVDGFVECRVKNPKQSRASSRRNLFLPLTGLFAGICEAPWGAAFLATRQACKLTRSGALDQPLVPGLSASGSWLPDCVSSGQLTLWLRSILSRAPDADAEAVGRLRSHSCKATLLSWGAKAGVSDKSLTLLDHHSLGVNMASVGYRRDALAGPLRELQVVVVAVRKLQFSPDLTRSGRWQEPSSPVSSASASVVTSPPSSAERAAAASRRPPGVPESSSDSDSSFASTDSVDEADQLVAAAPHFVENLLVQGGFAVATNKVSGLLHVLRQDSGRMLCGRLLSSGFEVSECLNADAQKFCRTCKTCALASS